MESSDVVIVGGGLSGLSAAVELSALGRKVLLLEQRRQCGGRTNSFLDGATHSVVDNGQHLMMGCYHATRRLLAMMGAGHLAALQPALRINFLSPSHKCDRLQCAAVPAPLHLLGGLLGFTAIPVGDRIRMLRVAKELMATSIEKERDLDRMTVDEWLGKLGQTEMSKNYLWNVLTIGALNNDPKNVSALMLFRVLRAAFLGNNKNASLLIPRVGLSDLFVKPAMQFIKSRGGEILTGVAIQNFVLEGTHVRSAQTPEGKEFSAPSFISAVPWYSFEEILSASHGRKKHSGDSIPDTRFGERFKSSPIISIHLWLDREITGLEFAALIETRIHWLFNRSKLLNENIRASAHRQVLSLVISSAQEFVGWNRTELVEMAMTDLRRVLTPARDAKVVHALVVKEKRATFMPAPGLEALRPGAQTKFDNLFLAGDWTATGYPATIEGAVMSGKTAADLVEKLLP